VAAGLDRHRSCVNAFGKAPPAARALRHGSLRAQAHGELLLLSAACASVCAELST